MSFFQLIAKLADTQLPRRFTISIAYDIIVQCMHKYEYTLSVSMIK